MILVGKNGEEIKFESPEDLERREAMGSIDDLRAAVDDLTAEGEETRLAYAEQVEELEAEVESWKNSYEREKKEKDELAVRFEVALHIPEE
jgi:molecular chaperone GrpE (heat shock protein)